MIRKCTKDDLNILNEYLYQKKELNLFVISDIEVFGLEDDNIEIFIDYDKTIRTIYLRFFNNMCLVSYENIIDNDFLKSFIEKHSIENINGERDLIHKIELDNFITKDFYFSSLNKLEIEVDTTGVSQLNVTNFEPYIDKCNKVFNNSNGYEAARAELEKNSKHIYVYKENDEVVSGASSSAESKELAMIVGVFTEENQRRKGLAKKCVFALSQKLLSEGKTVCLFYDNPNAAKMYEKIGFKHTGGFLSMLKKK
jgi:predicted GNAT family acetyltransferase